MKSNLIEVNFYFPKSSLVKNKKNLVDLTIEKMRKDNTIKYAGYSSEKILKKDLLRHIGHYITIINTEIFQKKKNRV